MFKLSFAFLPAITLALLFPLPGGIAAPAVPVTREWPPIALRGYGTLSGTQTLWQSPAGSILEIRCENEDKAKLVHAKYLSDLTLLPGVKQAMGLAPFPYWELAGDGDLFTAARSKNGVFIFQAKALPDLTALVQQHGPRDAAFDSEIEVPMFLDRWDRFGFRFYYGPWTQPPGTKNGQYDFNRDFDFAKKMDRSGLVIWDGPHDNDTAAGIMRVVDWDWAMEQARADKLPVAINDSGGAAHWLSNDFRAETMMRAPGYVGSLVQISDPSSAGAGTLSWGSIKGRDALLSELQGTVRRFDPYPNLVSWLEPDGEVPLTPQCLLTDYGPTADASYREYLKKTYHKVGAVSNRWYGNPNELWEWSQIHVPELANFRGGGKGSVDLAGQWKIGYEPGPNGKVYTPEEIGALHHKPVPTDPAPPEWYQPGFDDSAWPEITAPGHDIGMFIEKRPAVFRRTFTVDPAVRKSSARWWLYVWDLNRVLGQEMWAYLNGAKVGESLTSAGYQAHWAAFEVTSQLKDGANQVSLRLPEGFLGYRVYLSSQPVTDYPNLGEGKNAEWVDLINWTYDAHVDVIRRGVEMIRQIDPNRQITFMHPDDMGDALKSVAGDYGAEFHCTGYMSGFFAELEPMEMRGSGLPSSLEPGGPAHTLEEFKGQMGMNISEGVQSIDYFMHLGDVLWHDDIRAWFEDHSKMLHTVGKYHAPRAEVAMLIDDRNLNLTGYPWGADLNVMMSSGYWNWNVTAGLLELFHTDAVTESDFAAGNAARYKIIIDSNTSIMDDAFVDRIERYVRDGGVFVTYVQTGRHTPTRLNAWPIERLTGYHVTHIDAAVANGIPEFHPIQPAPGQNVFSGGDWFHLQDPDGAKRVLPNGLMLEKVAPDGQDLMLWDNGKTAVGMRPLGKGYIVEVGVKFTAQSIADRWDSPPRPAAATMNKLFIQLLDHFNVKHLPATLSEPYSDVMWRHYVSNNGLYDVWSLFNRSKTEPHTVGLTFERGLNPAACLEIKNEPAPILVAQKAGFSALENLAFEPRETRMFITPREHAGQAPADWFDLQRDWWRGTTPIRKEVPRVTSRFTIEQSQDWAFQPLDDSADAAPMSAPGYDDSKWERRPLGAWGLSDHPGVKHAILRKTFTVPAAWSKGRTYFWIEGWGTMLADGGRFFFDGKEYPIRNGIGDFTANDTLKPGTTHVAALEVKARGIMAGVRFPAWLSYLPDPQGAIDLAGDWKQSDDYLTYNKTLTLPGKWDGVVARRTLQVDRKDKGKNIFVDFTGPVAVAGLMINGVWLDHAHNWSQKRWLINITLWVRYGKDNELLLMGAPIPSRDDSQVTALKIDLYDPAVYP